MKCVCAHTHAHSLTLFCYKYVNHHRRSLFIYCIVDVCIHVSSSDRFILLRIYTFVALNNSIGIGIHYIILCHIGDRKGEGNLKCIAFSFLWSMCMHWMNWCAFVCIASSAHFSSCLTSLKNKKTSLINAEGNYYVMPQYLMMDLKAIFAIKTSRFNYMAIWICRISKCLAYFPFEIKLSKYANISLGMETKMELFNEQVAKRLNQVTGSIESDTDRECKREGRRGRKRTRRWTRV